MSWRRFFRRKAADADHAEEFHSHLEIEIEDNIARGMTAEEARSAALRTFGSATRLREEVYNMNRIPFLETLVRDLRYTLRTLGRNPGFTAAAIVCLALGIGATTAIFSVVSAVLLRPLPYANSERLIRVYAGSNRSDDPRLLKFTLSGPEFLALKKEARSIESFGGWLIGGANVTGGPEPFRPVVASVTGGLMESLGVAPLRGRLLTNEDDRPQAPRTAVISYGLWQRVFGGDPAAIGRDVLFSGRKCTIVGVMPSRFEFPPGEATPAEMWASLQLDSATPGSPFNHFLSGLARLKPGVTLRTARDEMRGIVTRFEAENAPNHLGFGPVMHHVELHGFHEEIVGSARPALLVLLGAVGFVLLIACVNVANLLLARAETRRREIAVRKAVGASLATLVRQFVTEGIVLSLAGATLGVGIAIAGIRFFTLTNAGNIPRSAEIGIDGSVLAFTLALSVATGLVFGLAPLAQMLAGDLHDTLKSSTSRSTGTVAANRFRQALVVGELALALVLLIGTGLMIRAFWKLQQVDIGMNPRNLLTMTTTLPAGVYPRPERVTQFWTDLQQRVSELPGVASVGVMAGLPPMRPMVSNSTLIEGYRPSADKAHLEIDFFQTVGPRFFETAGIRLFEGRFFDERDGPDAPWVVIINQSLARLVWGNASALGKRFQPNGPPKWATVVGVVADVKNGGIDQPAGTELFMPLQQAQNGAVRAAYLAVRTQGSPASITNAVRGVFRSLDPSLPVSRVREMDDVIASVQSRPRMLTVLLTAFATVALVLAAIGIYGVISYSVAQRTNEFGIRMAMGASSTDILGAVLRQGLWMGAAGLAIGTAIAFALTRFLAGVLFGISAVDPVTFLAMAGLLAFTTLCACYIPARRATKVDPNIALRYE